MKFGGINIKQAIIIRRDLKMSWGKIAGQCCHASIRAFMGSEKEDIEKWLKEGETKVMLKVYSKEELKETMKKFIESGLNNVQSVHDAGKTQIPEGALTAIGIGPYEDELIDEITSELKLL